MARAHSTSTREKPAWREGSAAAHIGMPRQPVDAQLIDRPAEAERQARARRAATGEEADHVSALARLRHAGELAVERDAPAARRALCPARHGRGAAPRCRSPRPAPSRSRWRRVRASRIIASAWMRKDLTFAVSALPWPSCSTAPAASARIASTARSSTSVKPASAVSSRCRHPHPSRLPCRRRRSS